MGLIAEITKEGNLKVQGFGIPPQDFDLYTPGIIVVPNSGFDSVTSTFACYKRVGRIVNVTTKFSIDVSSGPFNPTIGTPIFAFTVPFAISSAFQGLSDNYPIGGSADIYKDGQNLFFIGSMIAKTGILPSNYINMMIRNQNTSVLIQANNPFSLNFEFTYLCEEGA